MPSLLRINFLSVLFFAAWFAATLVLPNVAAASNRVEILAYGDSNTWGWTPVLDGVAVPRYDDATRWPGVLQSTLGPTFKVHVDGMIGRTLAMALPEVMGESTELNYNGRGQFANTLRRAAPVHLVILMLGTNDLIDSLRRDPVDIAKDLPKLVQIATNGTIQNDRISTRVLIVVPPRLSDTGSTPFKDLFSPAAVAKSKLLAAAYQRISTEHHFALYDANDVVAMDGIDGLHLSRASHKRLGEALARRVRSLLTH
jgi:lysophospholipase L1-like esterase